MIKKFLDKLNKIKSGNSSYSHAGKCPKCGLNILKSEQSWSCQGVLEPSCDFIIPRYTPDGREITMEQINFYINMLDDTGAKDTIIPVLKRCFNSNKVQQPNELETSTGTIDSVPTEEVSIATTQPETIKNQQPKNTVTNDVATNNTATTSNTEKVDVNCTQNKTQDTDISNKQKQNNNQQNTKEDERTKILKSSKRRKIENKCSCGGTIYRYGYKVACDKCNFLIGTKYANISFSDDEMSQLIGKRVSKSKTFTKKDGNSFKGMVFIDFDINGNLIPDYKFVNSPKNINGHYKEQLFAPDEVDRKNIPLSELFNNSKYSNNNSKKTYNAEKSNEPGAGYYKKYDPFKDQVDKGTSEKDDYKEYLKINETSQPF